MPPVPTSLPLTCFTCFHDNCVDCQIEEFIKCDLKIFIYFFPLFILVQLEGGHFQEQTQEYARWKELRDRLAADLRLSVSIGKN